MSASFRLALAQLNLWVGDVEGNVTRIVAAAVHARDSLGASLLACPELSLIGYPPDDLLLRAGLPRVIDAGVQRLLDEVRGITLVVGLPEFTAEGLYNAAWVLRDGRIVARARKQLLPNYGIFDERRHFLPGAGSCVFDHAGARIGLCICEDIWGAQPVAAAHAAGAQLILAINASPFDVGKSAERHAVFAARQTECGLPIAYVNCVGGQDDVVFDGDTTAVDGEGRVILSAPLFAECVQAVEFADGRLQASMTVGALRPAQSAEAMLYAALVRAVRDYVDRNGFPGVLLGMSGGIDSALVAAIAADALGSERVWGISLPSRYTSDMSNEDARLQAQGLGIRYDCLSIEATVAALTGTLAPLFAGRAADITEENLQSRSRGVLLMALSNKFGHVVLATGNKSEMAVGYATLYGDMCGGFAPIKDVYKTWVYRLARYRNGCDPGHPVIPERVMTRPPSAELRPDQQDSDSLPPYDVLDPILEAYIEDQLSLAQIVALGYEEQTVRRVAGLVRRAEYKRRQAPPGPKVSRYAFGRERRYPLTAVYGDI